MAFGATHWNVRPDVRRVAAHVAERYGCTWNTYYDHPPGLALDYTSVDFWGPRGRGDHLGHKKRRIISRYIRHLDWGPAWRWSINGRIGWYPSGAHFVPPGGAEWNAGHVHITYR